MQPGDIALLAPEIGLVAVALLVLLADLVTTRKGLLAPLAIAGLVIPAGLAVALWGGWLGAGLDSGEQRLLQVGDTTLLAVDQFALFFKLLVVAVVALVLLASQEYVSRFRQLRGEYYSLILLSAVGMMLLAAGTELVTIYVSLELATLPLVVLAAFLRSGISSEAAMKFFVLAAVSSALLLYGMVLVYGFTGTTEVAAIAGRVSELAQVEAALGARALLLGLVLMVAGFGFKVSAVPFQWWVPDVYQGAPTPITAYLSVASKAAAFAVVLRVFYVAFGSISLEWSMLFAVLAVASMTAGNLVAIAQSNIKRMLAYSTVAHAGYILVGLAAVADRLAEGDAFLGASGVLFYLVAYAATNLAAFFAVIVIANRVDSERIDDFAGMAQRAPLLALVLAVSMISLIGIPPTAGFMGKLYLFNAAVRADMAWLAIAGVINSVISAYYYLRVVRVMYLGSAAEGGAVPCTAAGRVALAVTAAGILLLGIVPAYVMNVARGAVGVIVGAS